MKTTKVKSTITAAAIACALISHVASATLAPAQQAAYDANPTGYMNALHAMLNDDAAGNKQVALNDARRMQIAWDSTALTQYRSGHFSLDQLLHGTGLTLADITPTAPADHGAAAAAKAAAKTTAQAQGVAAGKAAAAANQPQQPATGNAATTKAAALATAQAQGVALGQAAAQQTAAQTVAPATQAALTSTQRQADSNSQQIAKLNGDVKQLNHEMQDNQKEARAGVAGVAAMANIPTVRRDETVMFGAGVGGFKGESALAVGASVNVSDHTAVKFGVSDSTNGDVSYGAGVGIGF